MIILGLHDGHNATAALAVDGRIVACASEERFTRVKNDCGYPVRAVESVLLQAGIRAGQIDKVVFATKDASPFALKTKREATYKIHDYIQENHEYWKPLLYEGRTSDYWARKVAEPRFQATNQPYNIDFVDALPRDAWAAAFQKERARLAMEHLKVPAQKISFVDHHTAHAFYAYYASPRAGRAKAAVVTADGWGDGCNATISIAENGALREIHRTPMCNLGRMYSWSTLVLGMKPYEHEYMVMGLAPYAKAYIRDAAYKVYKETLVVDGLDFKWKNKPGDMYFYFRDKFEGVRFDGVAAGLQLWFEEMLAQWITNIMTHTGAGTLYFSGGLSMNVKANKLLGELPCVTSVFIPPSGGDESLSMGAAFMAGLSAGTEAAALEDAYLGDEPTAQESLAAALAIPQAAGYDVVRDPSDELLAGDLADGKVLGRCVGRMEFGARSLGNRAILCDASRWEQLRIINEKIKFRDFWMPFTPSILEERADDYLVNPKRIGAAYMTTAFDSTGMARDHLKAAIHPYDFTVRPQLVSPVTNKGYHALLTAFEKKTGMGGLLNTSLNLHGYPIARSAADAVHVLLNSGLDGLILPGVLIVKRDAPAAGGSHGRV